MKDFALTGAGLSSYHDAHSTESSASHAGSSLPAVTVLGILPDALTISSGRSSPRMSASPNGSGGAKTCGPAVGELPCLRVTRRVTCRPSVSLCPSFCVYRSCKTAIRSRARNFPLALRISDKLRQRIYVPPATTLSLDVPPFESYVRNHSPCNNAWHRGQGRGAAPPPARFLAGGLLRAWACSGRDRCVHPATPPPPHASFEPARRHVGLPEHTRLASGHAHSKASG